MQEWDETGGEFALVDPNRIQVDHRYQRPEKEVLIAAISKAPDWKAFGSLMLQRRGNGENGVLVIIDGQQRLKGVMGSEDPPKKVPAIIMPKGDLASEARTFVTVNVQRKSVGTLEKHDALVTAKDPAALAVKKACEKVGYSLGTKGIVSGQMKTIQAVASVYHAYNVLGEDGLVQVLTLTRDAWPDDSAATSVHMLRAVTQVLVDLGTNYNRPTVANKLGKVSPTRILLKAEELKIRKGGSKQVNVRDAIHELCKV